MIQDPKPDAGRTAGAERYPRFSPREFARRFAATRAMMTREGVHLLAVYGNSSLSRHNQADIHYLSGFLGNRRLTSAHP